MSIKLVNTLMKLYNYITEKKQSKPKYVVIYNMPDNVFSKMYSSVREMREDTGKKPSVLAKCGQPFASLSENGRPRENQSG
eukprot:SAG31_NODE_11_length_38734_cov_21.263854_8_plen_81_part_00